MQRADGFTPLHLVAARANVHDVHLGLIRLGEDTQVSWKRQQTSNCKILLSVEKEIPINIRIFVIMCILLVFSLQIQNEYIYC